MPTFLLEIGVEEIPAGMVAAAQRELERGFCELMERERLAGDGFAVRSYSTPRRLAVLAEGLLPKQADLVEQVIGPSTKVAFKDGAPTPAAIAFAKKSGADVDALETIQNAKGEYVAANVRRVGRTAGEVLAQELTSVIGGIYWPKNMYWRPGKPERFVRPIRWLLALLDEEVVPVTFAGIAADGASYGHRVLHGDAPVVVKHPAEYASTLRAAFVEVDPEVRKQRIRKALDAATRQVPGARWREDEALVDIVTNLTEWPSVVLGGFDASYLDLPEEVLVTVMRDHQKYFALEDANKKLLPNFLAVLNVQVNAAGEAIIRHGNERVLRARFNDARFFWDVDQKIPLKDRVEMLKHVTFHKDLGSYWEKTERNRELALRITELPIVEEIKQGTAFILRWHNESPFVERAAHLAKTDLTTEVVKEFPELQGVIGGLYARSQGESTAVTDAIYDQYRPASASDAIPSTRIGSIVALADKLSTIVDMFSIGLHPSGSRDPFALRRAGNGIIRILIEEPDIRHRLHLWRLCQAGYRYTTVENDPKLQLDIFNFLLDRLEYYLRERFDTSIQVARSIRNSGAAGRYEHFTPAIPYGNIAGFARTLSERVRLLELLTIPELLKRTSNILRQAREKKITHPTSEVKEMLKDPQEIQLAAEVYVADDKIKQSYRDGKYDEVIAAIASLREPLNAFFDSVMVMVDDPQVRANRLALLARTESVVRWAADFSELASIQ